MAYIGNTPAGTTVISVEARKSFSLSLRFADRNRRPADLTGCTVRLVVKAAPLDAADTSDADNIITSSTATIVSAAEGFCQFNVQAAELNHPAGEYPFAIVLVSPEGYSSVAVKGVVDLVQNTEFTSMLSEYNDAQAPSSLEVLLRGGTDSIDVLAGHVVPPGFTWMSDADKVKVDGLSLAGNLLPAGGDVGMVLRKQSSADYDFEWVEPQAYNGTLSAAGQTTGKAPVSDGAGGWTWVAVPSRSTGQPAGRVPTADGAGGWAWARVPGAEGIAMGVTDLNTLTAAGLYSWSSNSHATVEANFPLAGAAGHLEVLASTAGANPYLVQRYTARDTGRTFERRYAPSAWTAWVEYSLVGHVHAGTDITSGEVSNQRLPKLTGLRGVTRGTAAASGGTDGDVHLRYI